MDFANLEQLRDQIRFAENRLRNLQIKLKYEEQQFAQRQESGPPAPTTEPPTAAASSRAMVMPVPMSAPVPAPRTQQEHQHGDLDKKEQRGTSSRKWHFSDEEYERYSRQLILPGFGVEGQSRLRSARILIIGAGGLGCPAVAYLAGAGVGRIGLIDGDMVERSNLHRQVAHSTATVGEWKVESLAAFAKRLNPLVRLRVWREPLTSKNALSVIGGGGGGGGGGSSSNNSSRGDGNGGGGGGGGGSWSLVLDCTDNAPARYLISDACVAAGVPLVSAAALRGDGQCVVLNAPVATAEGAENSDQIRCERTKPAQKESNESEQQVQRGPCYRCLFPTPPPMGPGTATSCREAGVAGPAVGLMGVVMASEAMRMVINGHANSASGAPMSASTVPAPGQDVDPTASPSASPALSLLPAATSLLIFSSNITCPSASGPTFRSVRMRGKRPDCPSCSPAVREALVARLRDGSSDYVRFCTGGTLEASSCDMHPVTTPKAPALPDTARVEPREFAQQWMPQFVSGDAQAASPGTQQPENEYFLLDVREKEHFAVANIPGAVNVPMSTFMRDVRQAAAGAAAGEAGQQGDGGQTKAQNPPNPTWLPQSLPPKAPIYVVCRLGNDSQIAAAKLKEVWGLDGDGGERFVGDIRGGMRAWKRDVENHMPFI